MQTPSASSASARSSRSARAPNGAPMEPPPPAGFSMRTGHPAPRRSTAPGLLAETLAASRTVTSSSTTWLATAPNPLPRWLPTCTTSPDAPMACAAARFATRALRDRRSRSAAPDVARLMRYGAWHYVLATLGCSVLALLQRASSSGGSRGGIHPCGLWRSSCTTSALITAARSKVLRSLAPIRT